MNTLESKLTKVTTFITNFVLLLTPLFALPVTREFVIISKLYFFIYAVVGLLLVTLVYVLATRKVVWQKDSMVNGLLLLLIAAALSIFIMTPNRMHALFLPYGGFMTFLTLSIFYIFLVKSIRANDKNVLFYIGLSGLVSSIISIIAFVQPFRALELPAEIAFLNSPIFNTVGSQFDYILYTVFALVSTVVYFMSLKGAAAVQHAHTGHVTRKSPVKTILYVIFTVTLISLVLQIFQIVRAVFFEGQNILLPPFSISWFAAIEILKNPFTALFGVGLGNFAAIYTQVKDVAYNATSLWQISSFNVARSALMQIFTEMGIVGLLAIGFIAQAVVKNLKAVPRSAVIMITFGALTLLLMPPSFIVYFVIFVCLAFFSAHIRRENETYVADLSRIMPVFVITVVLFIAFIAGVTYFTSITFASEIVFKRALDAVSRNDVRALYENQRNSIIVYPYNEDFRRSFSQTNLLIANNIASKKPEEITDEDRQTITQAIQASIAEAKAAVALNPRKVTNWQYLATVYRNIINVAQGAELWTIASYQRAILLDPQNPVYRLELGGVYFLLQAYDDAQRLFEQAVALKPDWANAHYNLAWTLYRQEKYAAAARQMQRVISLIDRNTNKSDFEQAQKDLAEFQKKVAEVRGSTPSGEQTQGQPKPQDDRLNLPTPPVATFEPRIELDQNASPEAGLNIEGTGTGFGQAAPVAPVLQRN
ncbi:MAG: tetratricopeptide repeat protein [Patescibacteria group bacterium]|nr:tetratricopeptide repeat protein [Patescibacteria group bacterium]